MNERELIERYDQAWNDHDVDAIVSMHAADMVFENHTRRRARRGRRGRAAHRGDLPQLAGPPVPRPAAVRARGARRQRVDGDRDASDGRKLEWDGIDVFPIEDGKIKRKDVYSASGVAREVG